MTIRDDARQEAERRWADMSTDERALHTMMRRTAFEAGAVWASEQPDREPTPEEEREELANLIPLGFEARDGVRNVLEAADRILAAGFRKTDREPSERHDSTDTGSVAPPSDAEELARLRLERLEAVEDFITRHYLDTQMGERVLAIINGIEEVRRNG